MHVTRYEDAKSYEAPAHFKMAALRLQGLEVSPVRSGWLGLSHYLPGGGAERGASELERIYVVLSGEVTVTTDSGEVTLGPLDSCYVGPGEARAVINRSNTPASMLVFVSNQAEPGSQSAPR